MSAIIIFESLQIFGLEVKKIKRGTVESIILVNKLPASLTGGLLKWCVCVLGLPHCFKVYSLYLYYACDM